MKHIITFLLSVCFFAACAPARPAIQPGTIPRAEDVNRADEAYGQQVLAELSKKYPVSDSRSQNNRVQNIVRNLANAAGVGTQPWHVYVLQDDSTLNAAATRGNHVFVWTGLLRLVSNDSELAAVLGHEIGHVISGHTSPTVAEEVSQILVGTAGVATSGAIGGSAGAMGGSLAAMLAQALLINPGSQRMELEADHVGLFLMARAGYEPEASVSLWKKMSQQTGGQNDALAFLSTHPPNQERISQLEELIPMAKGQTSGSQSSEFNRGSNKTSLKKARVDRDTFDIGSTDPNQPQQGANTWKVNKDWAPVYMNPDKKSRVLNHIFYGTTVTLRSTAKNGWLELDYPLRGWVQRDSLKPD